METLTYEKIVSSIKERNYLEVSFSMSQKELDAAASDFLAFLSLPQEVKDSFYAMTDPNDRGSNAGYARKEKSKGDSDNKEYFNYRNITLRVLEPQIHEHGRYPEVIAFLNSANRIFNEAVRTLKQIIEVLDERHPGISAKIFQHDPDRFLALRFVKYDPAGKGEFLATAHYDRGSCALAIAESAPGLRVGRDAESLREVSRHGDTAIFMPAFTFGHDVGSDEFPPAWHDVVQASDATYSASVARWAIILFADVTKDEIISYEAAHTPRK